MIKTIEFNNKKYPSFQADGFAAQFAFPFAKHICEGIGFDIGCNKEEWSFPGSIPIDLSFDDEYHAMNLPGSVDYIFSSHCLEHLDSWIDAITYWVNDILKPGGNLFLYLPHKSQEYWLPWNNKKHKHILHEEDIINLLNINLYFVLKPPHFSLNPNSLSFKAIS